MGPWLCLCPEVVHGPCGVTTSPTLLGLVLMWSQQSYQRFLKTVTYFESSQDRCLRDRPKGKSGVKMNQQTSYVLK